MTWVHRGQAGIPGADWPPRRADSQLLGIQRRRKARACELRRVAGRGINRRLAANPHLALTVALHRQCPLAATSTTEVCAPVYYSKSPASGNNARAFSHH